MKKILLSLAFAAFGLTSGYAQTILSQNFTGATAPAMPTGWTNATTTTSTATGAASDAVAANAFDPSQFTVDLTQLFGSTFTTDLSQILANELPQLLGTQLSTDLLSVF